MRYKSNLTKDLKSTVIVLNSLCINSKIPNVEEKVLILPEI